MSTRVRSGFLQSRISRRVAARLSDRCEGLCTKAEVSNTPRQRSELLSDHSRAVRTNSRPLGAEESLLLIILDDLWRANLRIVRVKRDVTKSASLAKKPALSSSTWNCASRLRLTLGSVPCSYQRRRQRNTDCTSKGHFLRSIVSGSRKSRSNWISAGISCASDALFVTSGLTRTMRRFARHRSSRIMSSRDSSAPSGRELVRTALE